MVMISLKIVLGANNFNHKPRKSMLVTFNLFLYAYAVV